MIKKLEWDLERWDMPEGALSELTILLESVIAHPWDDCSAFLVEREAIIEKAKAKPCEGQVKIIDLNLDVEERELLARSFKASCMTEGPKLLGGKAGESIVLNPLKASCVEVDTINEEAVMEIAAVVVLCEHKMNPRACPECFHKPKPVESAVLHVKQDFEEADTDRFTRLLREDRLRASLVLCIESLSGEQLHTIAELNGIPPKPGESDDALRTRMYKLL